MTENSERRPLTMQEQWERYNRMMAAYESAMKEYREGKRRQPPPRPIMPHTPGPGA